MYNVPYAFIYVRKEQCVQIVWVAEKFCTKYLKVGFTAQFMNIKDYNFEVTRPSLTKKE